ncbi:uncharacterized protein F4817DRAFT_178877 [Daldinia loculata]|uniref:uncharacterized protein n=1 Tax=Daldinia loculata TaxID=103429 RepID=UPI0020C48D99|nr:uncharacterized protein F4817DRAFT_178877 [Daldinia loculata]KAI1651211.1 hypothetical protein F4817DRAFT_178877 [Daldinia loculata]
MPIINGQKMACEPCIRGHRSTKCAHLGDRMLLPVRKPGRPLSTCPHPPGKPCQCRNVTAALPKGGSCRCGGSPPSKTNGTPAIVKAEPSDNPPLSPTKQASFRIQKPTAKPNRKQSTDASASALQRMNANSLNLIGASSVLPASPANVIASSADYTNYIPPLQNGSHQYPSYPQIASRLDRQLDSSLLALNNGLSNISPTQPSRNGIPDRSNNSTVSSETMTSGASSSPYHTPISSTEDSSQEKPLGQPGSCCSQRVQQPPQIQTHIQFQSQLHAGPQQSSNMMGYIPQIPTGNGSMTAHFPPQVSAEQQIYPMNHFQQPALYSDQAPFGTYHFPLQQSQWEQLVANLLPQVEPNGGASGSYTSHVCHCGPECDCLGCPAHPYNQATCQYIRDVMAFQEEPVDGNIDTGNSIPDPPLAVGEASPPPPPTHSPVDTESPGANDLNLSPSEFLFVDYGHGMCGCGDDCACVNCMIHRDPLDAKIHGGSQDKTPN